MIKTPEEMLELSEKATKGPWSNKPEDYDILFKADAEFIASSREFVPYAAKRLIEAEELLKESEWAAGLFVEDCYFCGELKEDGHSPDCKLKKFLEAKNVY